MAWCVAGQGPGPGRPGCRRPTGVRGHRSRQGARPGHRQKWSARGGDPVGQEVPVALTVGAGLVLYRAGDCLRALDAATGKRRWDRVLPGGSGPAEFVQRVVVNGRVVVVIGTMRSPRALRMAVAGGKVYLTHQGRVLALDAGTGKEVWTYEVKADQSSGGGRVVQAGAGRVWVQVGGTLVGWGGVGLTAPAVRQGIVYFGSAKGLHALDARTGRALWLFKTPRRVTGRPVVANGVIYFATNEQVRAGGVLVAGVGRGKASGAAGPSCMYAVRLVRVSP
ncbi:MAG: hypothetical protein B1H04_00905 [Planctomycetales bacterium 4484_123]|nr:MAG: hypothetical protein B1H04_00905 [Planctomycetales bacterium 4484_123]